MTNNKKRSFENYTLYLIILITIFIIGYNLFIILSVFITNFLFSFLSNFLLIILFILGIHIKLYLDNLEVKNVNR